MSVTNPYNRWTHFTDRELRLILLALANSADAGSIRSYELIAEIYVEARTRGRDRETVITHEPRKDRT